MANSQVNPPDEVPDQPQAPGVIAQVYAQHLEEFQSLWAQRQAGMRSADYTLGDIAQLDQRLAAHFDGLLLGGEAAVPVVAERMAAGEAAAVFAGAYVLLSLATPAAADRVLDAFLRAEPEKLEGFRHALSHGPIEAIEPRLVEAARSAPAPVAAVAIEALVFHDRPNPAPERMAEFVQHESPFVRRLGWRITALSDPFGRSR